MYRFSPSAYTISAIRALRFGSYSISRDLPRNAELVALEVDLPVLPLVAAAPMARGHMALVVAAAGPLASAPAATSPAWTG